MTKSLRDAWRFFLAHAGYSTPPGKAVCALYLARAESQAQEAGITFEWDEDQVNDTSWCEICERGKRTKRGDVNEAELEHYQAHNLFDCVAKGPDGTILACLGGVDFGAYDNYHGQPYKRVVEAELASEALALLSTDYAAGMETE